MGKPTFDNGIPRPSVSETGLKSWIREVPGNKMRSWTSVIKRRNEISEYIGGFKRTQGTETSQYLEERTSTETPLVVASERGPGQWRMRDNRNRLESRASAGDSPVRVMRAFVLE